MVNSRPLTHLERWHQAHLERRLQAAAPSTWIHLAIASHSKSWWAACLIPLILTYGCMDLTFSYTIGIKRYTPTQRPGTCMQRDPHTHTVSLSWKVIAMHMHIHHTEGQGYKLFSTEWHFHSLISPSVAVNTSQWPSSSGYSLKVDGAGRWPELWDRLSRFNHHH